MALAKTNLSPEEQIRALITYDDQLAAGSSLESGAATLNDVASSIISQLNRIINSTVTGNDWFSGINTTTSGKTRGVNDLNTDLADLEEKTLLCRSQVLADVTVAASENWVILGTGELPTQVVAISLTQLGTVGASSALSGAGFAVHELIEIAGPNATSPKNLVLVRDTTTLQPIQSGGRDVYGLMQFESGLADGDTITATTPDRAKLSFVRVNSGGTDLEAVPVADIENAVINYSYVFRTSLENVDEDCFLANGTFTDLTASVDVTRQEAYSNQGTTPVDITSSATLDLEGAGVAWTIRDDTETALFTLTENSGTSATTLAVGAAVDAYNNNAVDVNFDNGVTVDNGSNAINLGVTPDQIDFTGNATVTSSTGSTVTVTADSANATLSTTSSGNVIVNSVGTVDVDGTSVTIDASTGGVSLDAVASSNFTVTSATSAPLTISTVTSGDVNVTAADDVNHSADNHLFDVTSLDTGVLKAEVNKFHWENSGGGAMYPKLNADFTSTTATTAGFVVAYDATGTSDTIAAPGFTAGVAATSNPTVQTTGAATFSAGDLVLITGAAEESNNGLYEVLTHAANVLTIRGIGTTDVVEAFTDRQLVTSTSTAGAITGMNVTVLQADATGAWGSGQGSTTPITFTAFGSAGGNSLQQAYEQGNTVSVSAAEGIITFSNSTDATNVLEVSRTFAGAGVGIDVSMGASTTGVGVNIAAAGSGDAFFLNNTGTGAAFTVQDGGTDVLDVSAAGGVTVTPTSAQSATITTTGAGGTVDINSGDAVTIDAVAASNFTVTGADLVVSTVTSGELDLTSAGLMDVNAGANLDVDVTGTMDLLSTGVFSIDGTGASNVTAASGTLTLSSTTSGNVDVTAADEVNVTSGNGGVLIISDEETSITAGTTVDILSGSTSDVNTTAGNAIFSAVSDLDKNATDVAGNIRLESSYLNLENRNEGNVALAMNTGYTASTGTNNYQVFVVAGSTVTATTVDTGGFTAGTAGTSDATVVTVGSATFSAGQFVSITHHGGATNEKNLGIFEVLTHVATTLTIRGPLAAPTAGAEFVRQNFVTDTTTGAAITLVTLSVLRSNSSGQMQIAENFSDIGTISYVDIGTTANLLSTAINNQLTTGAFTQNAGTLEWGIPDGGRVEFGDASNNLLFELAGDGTSGGSITGVGGNTSDGAGGLISFTGGAATTATEPGGGVTLASGAGNTTGASGDVTISTANANAVSGAQSGNISITTGSNANTAGVTTGSLTLSTGGTGLASAGDSGPATLSTGNVGGTGVKAGNLTLSSGGDAAIGGSGAAAGDILITQGASDGASGDFGSGVGSISILGSTNSGTALSGAVIVRSGGNSGTGGTVGAVTIEGGAKTTAAGAGGQVNVTGGAGFGTGAGGALAFTSGAAGATGVGGAVNITSADGGATSGNGGDVTITSGDGPTNGRAGAITLTGGNTTSNEDAGGAININAGDASDGNGGAVSITGGTGSDTRSGGTITLQSGAVSAGNGSSGSITLETIAGVGTGSGGDIILNGGNSGAGATGDGADITVSAGDAASTNGNGGNVTFTSGINTGTGSAGVVSVGTGTGAVIGQDDIVLTLDNNGSGTGGGEVMSLYTGTAAPSHTANAGSLFLLDSGTTGSLYVNESTGGSGATWSQVTTTATAVSRNFFQDTITSSVSPGGTLTAASFTGGVIAVKPSAEFSFDLDAQVFLNGVLLMNGATNEVSSGAGNSISVGTAGPTFRVGDVVTIVYHTNSTNNTA